MLGVPYALRTAATESLATPRTCHFFGLLSTHEEGLLAPPELEVVEDVCRSLPFWDRFGAVVRLFRPVSQGESARAGGGGEKRGSGHAGLHLFIQERPGSPWTHRHDDFGPKRSAPRKRRTGRGGRRAFRAGQELALGGRIGASFAVQRQLGLPSRELGEASVWTSLPCAP